VINELARKVGTAVVSNWNTRCFATVGSNQRRIPGPTTVCHCRGDPLLFFFWSGAVVL